MYFFFLFYPLFLDSILSIHFFLLKLSYNTHFFFHAILNSIHLRIQNTITILIWTQQFFHSIYLRIEYELEFIFTHRNSTILSFHHIYYLLTNIFEYSIIFTHMNSGIVLNSFLHSYFFMNMYIHLLLYYSPIIILTLT